MLAVITALLLLWIPQADVATSANVWKGREAEFEQCLRTAKVLKVEAIPIGVTKPTRAYTEPGSMCESFAWKPLRPGIHKGFWDSYKSEIAAYELDKMMGLGMVPPIVERDVQHERGAAVLWLKGVHSWEEALRKPKAPTWTRNVVRMKMWDNLVGNADRNKGNILVDQAGDLYLIDHSRAFIADKKLPSKLESYVDRELWEKMQALTYEALKERIGQWVGNGEIRAMLSRRDKMAKEVEAMVAKRGDHAWVKVVSEKFP